MKKIKLLNLSRFTSEICSKKYTPIGLVFLAFINLYWHNDGKPTLMANYCWKPNEAPNYQPVTAL